MNNCKITAAIEELKSTTSTCCNGNTCINLILNLRRFFFSLPAKEHSSFIDIAEGDHGIFFDNDTGTVAMTKCAHPNDFDVFNDVAFIPLSGANPR